MEVDEQMRRAGAERFGVDPESFKSLGGDDGAVYACRRGNLGYAIKFVPINDEKFVLFQERLDFVRFLYDCGVPVAVPLDSLHQRSFERISSENASFLVTLTQIADGRHPEPRNLYDWNDRLFMHWGRVTGKMHAAARHYPKWQKLSQENNQPSSLPDWNEEHQSFFDWCGEAKIQEKWRPFKEIFSSLPQSRNSYGLIHNDLHPWNFFYDPDARDADPIFIIDFDVCTYHWFVNDIAIAVYHAVTSNLGSSLSTRRVFARHFLAQFMTGYRQENELDETWFVHLPVFLKYREILLYIALSNTWPEAQRNPWQKRFLAEKRARTLHNEPIL